MYRTVDCATWDDPWFEELEPLSKLLFLYLITNRRQTACGVFEITTRAAAFETGIMQKELELRLKKLAPKVLWWPDGQIVWVTNFYKHQRANTNDKFVIGAQRALAKFPDAVRQVVCATYPELKAEGWDGGATPMAPPWHGGTETVTVTVEETVTEAETKTAQKARAGADNFTPFVERCWQKYPRDAEGRQCGSKKQFVAQVKALPVSQWEDFEQAVENYGQSRNVKRGYVKAAESWVKLGLWQNFVGSAEAREVEDDRKQQQQRPETRYTRTAEYLRQRAAEAAQLGQDDAGVSFLPPGTKPA